MPGLHNPEGIRFSGVYYKNAVFTGHDLTLPNSILKSSLFYIWTTVESQLSEHVGTEGYSDT